MRIGLASAALVFFLGCGSESSNNEPQTKGPKNHIINTASEEEFLEESSKALKLFNDFEKQHQNFSKDTQLISSFIDAFSSKMVLTKLNSDDIDDENEEASTDLPSILFDLPSSTSCAESLTKTDKLWQNAKNEGENILAILSGNGEPQASDEGSYTLAFERATTEDAIAYNISLAEQSLPGMSITGQVTGRMDKDNGIIQIYKAINRTIDNKKISEFFGQHGNNNASDPEASIGLDKFDEEYTLEINTKNKTLSFYTSMHTQSLNNAKTENNYSLKLNSEEIYTAGNAPSIEIIALQERMPFEEESNYTMTFSMQQLNTKMLAVKIAIDQDGKTEKALSNYKLEMKSNACSISKD